MTGTLLYEIRPSGAKDWLTLGTLTPGDQEGSITDITDGRRNVLLFRCEGERSIVSRSVGGTDWEVGAERVVVPLAGRERVAVLADGQSYERQLLSDAGLEYRARWTHRANGA